MGTVDDDLSIPAFLKVSAEERKASWERFLKKNGGYTMQFVQEAPRQDPERLAAEEEREEQRLTKARNRIAKMKAGMESKTRSKTARWDGQRGRYVEPKVGPPQINKTRLAMMDPNYPGRPR